MTLFAGTRHFLSSPSHLVVMLYEHEVASLGRELGGGPEAGVHHVT